MTARRPHLTHDGAPEYQLAGPGADRGRLAAGGALAAALAVATLAVATLAAGGRPVRRVEVVGLSMAPTLQPGDRLVVVAVPHWGRAHRAGRAGWPAPGDVVALRDPRDARRTLVKRVRSVDVGQGTLEVEGDAPASSTDSRTFGPVPRSSLLGRVVYRYAPPASRGPLTRPGEYHRA